MNVLSGQSHVTHGYVGNRAAVFPLQLRGWDVDVLNTVQLSNNTGYGSWTGTKATPQEIRDVYDGLKSKKFEYNALLTGYVPSAEGLQVVGEIGKDLKTRFPEAVWLLDPVMGDDGKLYVSEGVIPVYKEILKTGLVSLITPNGFEAETLTGIKLDSKENIKKVLKTLHDEYKVPNVVLSSVQLPGSDKILAVGSTCGEEEAFYYEVPALDSYFTGTGDLFAALMVDRFCTTHSLKDAMNQVLKTIHGVLTKTMKYKQDHGVSAHGIRGNPDAMKAAELQIIASRDIIIGTEKPALEDLNVYRL